MAYSYCRQAAQKFDPDTVKQIKDMTSQNDHVRARITGAKMIGATKLLKLYELVNRIQDLSGGLPPALGKYRDSLDDQLFARAKRELSAEEYQQFHKAY